MGTEDLICYKTITNCQNQNDFTKNIISRNYGNKYTGRLYGIRDPLVTVFYDGKCGLCSREINHYKKIAPNGMFDWQDVTEVSPKRLKSEGLTLVDGLRLLHAKDKNGDLKIGVDAFILIWSQLNRWHILAKIVSWTPGIRQIAGIAYTFFA